MKFKINKLFISIALIIFTFTSTLLISMNTDGKVSSVATLTVLLMLALVFIAGLILLFIYILKEMKNSISNSPRNFIEWKKFFDKFKYISYVFVCISIILALNTTYFINASTLAKGSIIQLIEHKSSDGSSYTPVYRFKDATNFEHTIKASFSSSPPIGNVGDTLEVYYDKNNPENAKINYYFDLWGFSTIFGFFGLLIVLIRSAFKIISKFRKDSTMT